jgi:hypothetical protein
LLAHEEIRQLVSHYAVHVDARDLDALVELFVDDVRVGRGAVGRDALKASFREALLVPGIMVLNVGTHAIDLVDDDHATGIVYCKGEVQQGDRWIHQLIVYTDEYERRDGRWYFVRRRHELVYGADVGQNPLPLPPADWPRNEIGRGTLPERWETWQSFQASREA